MAKKSDVGTGSKIVLAAFYGRHENFKVESLDGEKLVEAVVYGF